MAALRQKGNLFAVERDGFPHFYKWYFYSTLLFLNTYGISSGRTSAIILIESVLALDVGAAASRIFSRAIIY